MSKIKINKINPNVIKVQESCTIDFPGYNEGYRTDLIVKMNGLYMLFSTSERLVWNILVMDPDCVADLPDAKGYDVIQGKLVLKYSEQAEVPVKLAYCRGNSETMMEEVIRRIQELQEDRFAPAAPNRGEDGFYHLTPIRYIGGIVGPFRPGDPKRSYNAEDSCHSEYTLMVRNIKKDDDYGKGLVALYQSVSDKRIDVEYSGTLEDYIGRHCMDDVGAEEMILMRDYLKRFGLGKYALGVISRASEDLSRVQERNWRAAHKRSFTPNPFRF